jgi:hypothetical protein
MNKELILQMQSQFDALAQTHSDATDVEFWFARDLQEPLGYVRWENFLTAIQRAKGGQRPVEDFMLTRYACYLIAQNGDPRKEPIALLKALETKIKRRPKT